MQPFRPPVPGTPRYTSMPSPVGELTLVGDGASLTAVYLGATHRWAPEIGPDWVRVGRCEGEFAEVTKQLTEYFDNRRTGFDLPLAPTGTAFRLRVWAALLEIPYGGTVSYGEIAARLGHGPAASRAVGAANGRNPISIVVPCHRVLGAGGALVGYGGGLDRKRTLLDLESLGADRLW